jgi:hypothetical protein
MIKINGKEYKFRFGFKALLIYEELTGKSVSDLGENLKMASIVDIAYSGIKAEGEEVTREMIIDAIDADFNLLKEVTEKMQADMEALTMMGNEAKK